MRRLPAAGRAVDGIGAGGRRDRPLAPPADPSSSPREHGYGGSAPYTGPGRRLVGRCDPEKEPPTCCLALVGDLVGIPPIERDGQGEEPPPLHAG